MSTPRQRAIVDSILKYLALERQAAEMANQRAAAIAIAQAWLFVHDGLYGRVRSPQPVLLPATCWTPVDDRRSKVWFRQKYMKPMRKVVANEEYLMPHPYGEGHQSYYGQRLECGHVIMDCYDVPGVNRPKHRRCAECAPQELTAPVLAEEVVVQ